MKDVCKMQRGISLCMGGVDRLLLVLSMFVATSAFSGRETYLGSTASPRSMLQLNSSASPDGNTSTTLTATASLSRSPSFTPSMSVTAFSTPSRTPTASPSSMPGYSAFSQITDVSLGFQDVFGSAVALSCDGQWLAAGAPQAGMSHGAVYVYQWLPNSGIWNNVATLTAADTTPGDTFGSAVAMSCDGLYIGVGAPQKQVSSLSSRGSAYIFKRSGSSWQQQSILVPSTVGNSGDMFGSSIALSADGSWAVVGAPAAQPVSGKGQTGAATVFERFGTTWNQQALLYGITPAATAGDLFGTAVAISNDASIIIIGAPSVTVSNNQDQGVIYVFQNQQKVGWTNILWATPSAGAAQDAFGSSIAFSAVSGTVVVGSPNKYGSPGYGGMGGATFFSWDGVHLSEIVDVICPDGGSINSFGKSLAISSEGGVVAIGAPARTMNTGAVYLYFPKDGTWLYGQRMARLPSDINDAFGTSLALASSGYAIAAGASGARTGGMPIGAVFLSRSSVVTPVDFQTPTPSTSSSSAGSGIGGAIAGILISSAGLFAFQRRQTIYDKIGNRNAKRAALSTQRNNPNPMFAGTPRPSAWETAPVSPTRGSGRSFTDPRIPGPPPLPGQYEASRTVV